MAPAGYVKGALESIPGNEDNTPTLSTKVIYLPSVGFDAKLNPTFMDPTDELRNEDEPLALDPEAYDPSWDLDVRGYPDTLGFLLSLGLGLPTSTPGGAGVLDPDGNEVPDTAHRHVWAAPFGPTGMNPKTAEWILSYSAMGYWAKMKGAALEKLTIDTPSEGGMQVKANGPALYATPLAADPALTPTLESLAIPAFLRSHMQVTSWLASTAETDDVTIALDFPVVTGRTLAIASMYPDVMEKGDAPISISGSMPKRAIAKADMDAMMAGTPFDGIVRWQSTKSILATAYKYAMWLEMPHCQYTEGGPEPLANKRRIGSSFGFKATTDGTVVSATFTLVNDIASYA